MAIFVVDFEYTTLVCGKNDTQDEYQTSTGCLIDEPTNDIDVATDKALKIFNEKIFHVELIGLITKEIDPNEIEKYNKRGYLFNEF